MDAKTLIPLPVFDAVAQTATDFLLQGKNVAIVGPPGAGATSVSLRVQQQLSTAKVPFAVFDCAIAGDLDFRHGDFSGPKSEQSCQGVVIVDHAAVLTPSGISLLSRSLQVISAEAPTAILWLGALDAHNIKTENDIELHTDIRTHLCLPELGRDDLLRLYRAISASQERRWGEAMLYFALDWCGNDLALANQLVEHFYGDWTERIYDDAVGECLAGWLAKSLAISGYRQRFAALPDQCKEQLRLLCGGGKLVSHRPEVHLETCDKMRRLFLDGFLCANTLPGYYQFRHLAARFVVMESMGLKTEPIEMLRRAANARVNLLLQDIEVSLRSMLSTVFRQMPTEDVKKLLKNIKVQTRMIDADLQLKLKDWARQQTQPNQPDLRGPLGLFLSQEDAKYRAANNLWSEICRVFREANELNNNSEPTPEQAVSCLTFNQLKDLLLTSSDRLFLDKPRTKRLGEHPSKRWSAYLTLVRRLRNDAAHLRNISFQDTEDLLKDLNKIREDQLDFGIIP